MGIELKQFVPSEVCLKCNGCCRYKEAASPWSPKLGQEDINQLGVLITAGETLDVQNYLRTDEICGQHFCRFFNQGDNSCKVYSQRPFECSLYPFILSKTIEGVRVYVHLACPYVQDYMSRPIFDSHVQYLKEFFRQEETRAFLSGNKAMFHDYSPYAAELLHLFDLTFL